MFGASEMIADATISFEEMKVRNLKDELLMRGVSRSGLKAALQRRLHGLIVQALQLQLKKRRVGRVKRAMVRRVKRAKLRMARRVRRAGLRQTKRRLPPHPHPPPHHLPTHHPPSQHPPRSIRRRSTRCCRTHRNSTHRSTRHGTRRRSIHRHSTTRCKRRACGDEAWTLNELLAHHVAAKRSAIAESTFD